MGNPYLTYFKKGFFYTLLFMGLNVLVELITNYQETITFLRALFQTERTTRLIVFFTLLIVWITISLIISLGLIGYDYLKKKTKNKKRKENKYGNH